MLSFDIYDRLISLFCKSHDLFVTVFSPFMCISDLDAIVHIIVHVLFDAANPFAQM